MHRTRQYRRNQREKKINKLFSRFKNRRDYGYVCNRFFWSDEDYYKEALLIWAKKFKGRYKYKCGCDWCVDGKRRKLIHDKFYAKEEIDDYFMCRELDKQIEAEIEYQTDQQE